MHNELKINTLGRRKTSIARIILTFGNGDITVNQKPLDSYFKYQTLTTKVRKPFLVTESVDKYDIFARVEGGGPTGQAGALQLGIARALVKVNDENKTVLRKNELLTRDSRMVERKKYGRKKARKRFQFSKR
ncbi:MAG: 30S ribosomal protein S9 [Ignavibacteria bacterium]|nr:30S ribosomal protein S9 [Bacteroidota bacterium]MSQ45768.1 30S ribosomal protein S9 [Ignavibacteria bacterium]